MPLADQVTKEWVTSGMGAAVTTLQGAVKGSDPVDYTVGAKAGQPLGSCKFGVIRHGAGRTPLKSNFRVE